MKFIIQRFIRGITTIALTSSLVGLIVYQWGYHQGVTEGRREIIKQYQRKVAVAHRMTDISVIKQYLTEGRKK